MADGKAFGTVSTGDAGPEAAVTMLKIGFTCLRNGAEADVGALQAIGCQVVRKAQPGEEPDVLRAILDFIGRGDELVVTRLDRLAGSTRLLLETLNRIEARGASLRILQPPLSTEGTGGSTLRTVLEALSDLEPGPRPNGADVHEILALQKTGLGPVEIARRLGVSRMTVWRKLKSVEPR